TPKFLALSLKSSSSSPLATVFIETSDVYKRQVEESTSESKHEEVSEPFSKPKSEDNEENEGDNEMKSSEEY
ncbi:MAG: hypothetical protein KGD68_06320, partial [Candidatus Lokiarchaeota archaeon]|nr:hypothetical protein [Candidatus Lokiarchaeota archaeon]